MKTTAAMQLSLISRYSRLCFTAVILSLTIEQCNAITPSAVIELSDVSDSNALLSSIYASGAVFGPHLTFGKPLPSNMNPSPIRFAPDDNPLMCDSVEPNVENLLEDFIFLIPRGGCSFKNKVRNAEILGAKHAIIYDNLAAKYELDDFDKTKTLWPVPQLHYECGLGRAFIPVNELKFDTLPYANKMTGSKGDGNLCAIYKVNNVHDEVSKFEDVCPSQRCVMTGGLDFVVLETKREACCAWDLYMDMGDDPHIEVEVHIPSTFLTMEAGDNLIQMVQNNEGIRAVVYERWHPQFNISSILTWLLGTWVTWISSWMSAKAYRDARKKLETTDIDLGDLAENPPVRNVTTNGNGSEDVFERGTNDDETHDLALDVAPNAQNEPLAQVDEHSPVSAAEYITESSTTSPMVIANEIDEQGMGRPPAHQREHRPSGYTDRGQEVLDLRLRHAGLFLVVSSSVLFLLFFTRVYDLVKVFYVFGGSASVAQVMINPALLFVSDRFGALKPLKRPLLGGSNVIDILSFITGFGSGTAWLWLSFTVVNFEVNTFYWVFQTLMGISVCIVFLGVVRLNSIRVATFLLVAAFIYDVFFVFLTPYLFGESVMVTVATGGGTAEFVHSQNETVIDDPYHCEKYPSSDDCNNIPLPMLFAIPRINDYRGGMIMLGLGDIVLPGK